MTALRGAPYSFSSMISYQVCNFVNVLWIPVNLYVAKVKLLKIINVHLQLMAVRTSLENPNLPVRLVSDVTIFIQIFIQILVNCHFSCQF